jgi:hypothetical protein
MKVVDIVFGKRITGSFYHIQGSYMSRKTLKEDVLSTVDEAINEILDRENLPDEVMTIFNRVKGCIETIRASEGSEIKEVVKDLNSALASLSYLEYEFYAIVRNDLDLELGEDFNLDEFGDRTYAMTKQFNDDKIFGIDNFTYGIGNTYDEMTVNINAMVMDFVEADRIKISDEDEALTQLPSAIEEYRNISARNESNYMDTSKVLNLFEKLGYKFIIVYNNVEGE